MLELPLTAMDGVLFRTLKLDGVLAHRRVREHLDSVEAARAMAVLLWHPNAISTRDFPGWWDAYCRILEDLASRGAWVATGDQIKTWWQEREREMDTAATPR